MTKTNTFATKSRHVTPHTQTKRPGGTIAGSGNNAKRSKYGHHHQNKDADNKHKKTSAPPPPPQPLSQPMDLVDDSDHHGVLFDRLDPANPVHDHRIKQRRKMIAKGKNTAGYDHYLQQVPKSRRKARSLKTPSTPDATLDIPAKRWNGLVRAWRKSLHQYDPADLVNSLSTSMTLSTTTAVVGKGDATNANSGSSRSNGSFSSKTPSTSLESSSTSAKKRTIENMASAARTPSASSNSTKNDTTDDHDDFLPDDESSPISLLSATSSCRDLDHDAFGTAHHGGVFSTTARKNLVSGATGWGDLDSSDDDDDLL